MPGPGFKTKAQLKSMASTHFEEDFADMRFMFPDRLNIVSEGDSWFAYPPDWLLHYVNLRRAEKRLGDIPAEMGLAEAQGNEPMQAQLATEFHEMGALKEHSRSAKETVEVEHALV